MLPSSLLRDVNDELLQATQTSTYCPFKGHASYWSTTTANDGVEDAVWGYLAPYSECLGLQDHVAFYTDKVVLEIDGERQGSVAPGWTS